MLKISVIIPFYNAEKTLEKTIKSVLQQKEKTDVEIILVDDGSTDNSYNIAKKYSDDANIRLFKKENGGVSSARNLGLEYAAGDYITFVDSDDELEKDCYSKILDYVNSNDFDIIVYGVSSKKEKDNIIKNNVTDIELSKKQFSERFFDLKQYNLYSACNKLFKRETVENIRFETGRISAEDQFFCLEAYEKANSYKFVPIYGYIYNLASETSVSKFLSKNYSVLYELESSINYNEQRTKHYRNIGISDKQMYDNHCKVDYIWFYNLVKNIFNNGSPYKSDKEKRVQIKKIMKEPEHRKCILHSKSKKKLAVIVKLLYIINSPQLVLIVFKKI